MVLLERGVDLGEDPSEHFGELRALRLHRQSVDAWITVEEWIIMEYVQHHAPLRRAHGDAELDRRRGARLGRGAPQVDEVMALAAHGRGQAELGDVRFQGALQRLRGEVYPDTQGRARMLGENFQDREKLARDLAIALG